MNFIEQEQLDELLTMAQRHGELTDWEKGFVASLDNDREQPLTPARASVFERMVQARLVSVAA